MGIDTYYGYVKYVLGGRVDGEGGRGGKEATVISNIKIVIIIAVYIFLLIALYYI